MILHFHKQLLTWGPVPLTHHLPPMPRLWCQLGLALPPPQSSHGVASLSVIARRYLWFYILLSHELAPLPDAIPGHTIPMAITVSGFLLLVNPHSDANVCCSAGFSAISQNFLQVSHSHEQ